MDKPRYYFIDTEIYYQGKKQPSRKVELFNVNIIGNTVYGADENDNEYEILKSQLIVEP